MTNNTSPTPATQTQRGCETVISTFEALRNDDSVGYIMLPNGRIDSARNLRYRELYESAHRIAAELQHSGLIPGDRAVLAVAPGLHYVTALFGSLLAGVVAVPSYPPLRPVEGERFDRIVSDCAATAIIVDNVTASLPGIGRSSAPQINVEHVGSAAVPGFRLPRVCTDDLAIIQYTSGSTGAPKGVCISHGNLTANLNSIDAAMDHPDRCVGFSWLPPYHDMGLIGLIIMGVYRRWPLAMMSPLHFIQHPLSWLQNISDLRATTTAAPNFALQLCVDAVADGALNDTGIDMDLSSLRELFCGAEPLHRETLEKFINTFEPLGLRPEAIVPCYGMAEATLYVAGKPSGTTYLVKDGHVSCGVPDPAQQVLIVDPRSGRPQLDGQPGEIWIHGPNVSDGYFGDSERTARTMHAIPVGESNRFLRTGDIGRMIDGELFVDGRANDVVIHNGRNIFPEDLEATVTNCSPIIHRSVVIGIPGEGTADIAVIVEVDERAKETDTGLAVACNISLIETIQAALIMKHHVGAKDIHVGPRKTIPLTTSGKVRRSETRQRYVAGTLPQRLNP